MFFRVALLLSLLLALAAPVLAQESPAGKKRFVLYAAFLENTPVELTDGTQWMMDKGDVFPVEMYKDMQRKIVLRLAGETFLTESARTRILKPAEVEQGLESYRKTVANFIESRSKKMREALEKKTTADTPAPDKKP